MCSEELFLDDNSDEVLPHRLGHDIAINLELDENKFDEQLPYGLLYEMSRDELVALRKTLANLLDKGCVCACASPASLPFLFARKPSAGLSLCVDYRSLNTITKKDHYPLPLIRETIRQFSKARYFTKLDVRSAFHRLRIREGDEWKTAFCTRQGLFQWLVCQLGLSNAPAAFQRNINNILRHYLDIFCSVYIDDVIA